MLMCNQTGGSVGSIMLYMKHVDEGLYGVYRRGALTITTLWGGGWGFSLGRDLHSSLVSVS